MTGSARLARASAVAVAALCAVEAVTGFGLAAYYAPTAAGAWASVRYLQDQVVCGWLLRGVHHFSAHALVLALGAWVLCFAWRAGYRSPGERGWWAALVVANLCLALSHTGILLPADQRAHFATQVLLGAAQSVPGVGAAGATVLRGGEQIGNVTLTHFYALHAWLLPVALVAVAVWSLRRTNSEAVAPEHRVFDLTVALCVLSAVAAWVCLKHGAPLAGPADPTQDYPARPEWYFYPLYELRRRAEGRFEWVATVVLPGLALAALAGFPYWERRLSASGRDGRRVLAVSLSAALLVTAGLGVAVALRDQGDARFQQAARAAEHASQEAQRLAAKGVPVQGPLFLYQNDSIAWGSKVFREHCQQCHPACAPAPYKGAPCLEGYASREWLKALLQDPHGAHFFGNTKLDEMDSFSASTDRLNAVVEFVFAQGGHTEADARLVELGKNVYANEGCDGCHSLDGHGTGTAPDLKGYAGAEWLAEFIQHPQADRFYGKANEMDPFGPPKLEWGELQAVVAFLQAAELKNPGTWTSMP